MTTPHPWMRSSGLSLHNKISDKPMGDDSRLKHRANTVETVIGIVSAPTVYGTERQIGAP